MIPNLTQLGKGKAVEILKWSVTSHEGFPGGSDGKESACQCKNHRRPGFDSWVRKIPWRREWQPPPVSWPEESYGQRRLAAVPDLQRVRHDWATNTFTFQGLEVGEGEWIWGKTEGVAAEKIIWYFNDEYMALWVSEWSRTLSGAWLFAALWTVARQALPSMGFPRQECWSGLPFPSPGDLPNPGIKPRYLPLNCAVDLKLLQKKS